MAEAPSPFRFPNESDAYRRSRDRLLDEEVALREQVEAVARKRRELPLGGRLAQDYVFEESGADGERREVPFAELFSSHDTLLLYSMMFGPEWDAPCPSCASIVEGLASQAHQLVNYCGFAVVAAARPAQLRAWAARRGWTSFRFVSGDGCDYMLDYAVTPVRAMRRWFRS